MSDTRYGPTPVFDPAYCGICYQRGKHLDDCVISKLSVTPHRCIRCDSVDGHHEFCHLHPLQVRTQLAAVTINHEELEAAMEEGRQNAAHIAEQFRKARNHDPRDAEIARLRAERDGAYMRNELLSASLEYVRDRFERFKGWRVRYEYLTVVDDWRSGGRSEQPTGKDRALRIARRLRGAPEDYRNIRIVRVFSAAKRGK